MRTGFHRCFDLEQSGFEFADLAVEGYQPLEVVLSHFTERVVFCFQLLDEVVLAA